MHPELEEFKPVDLEPDDPDRDADFTVVCPVCERKFKHKTTCTVHIKVFVFLQGGYWTVNYTGIIILSFGISLG